MVLKSMWDSHLHLCASAHEKASLAVIKMTMQHGTVIGCDLGKLERWGIRNSLP